MKCIQKTKTKTKFEIGCQEQHCMAHWKHCYTSGPQGVVQGPWFLEGVPNGRCLSLGGVQMEPNQPVRVHLVPFVHSQSYTPVWGHLEPTQGHFETHWCSRVFPVSQHAQYQHPDSVWPEWNWAFIIIISNTCEESKEEARFLSNMAAVHGA